MSVPVSIVMTYHERLAQLRVTLRSFELHGYSDVEVIVVDDGSVREPLREELLTGYRFPVRVERMSPDKSYSNVCVPWNVGIGKATGQIIVLQNSECAHVDDVLRHARANVSDENYLTYSCYSLGREKSERLFAAGEDWQLGELTRLVTEERAARFDGDDAWYNHSVYRPCAYHFCSALSRKNLVRLKGFDERYAPGFAFDDTEFLWRVRRMGLDVSIVDDVVVLHQWHYSHPRPASQERLFARNHLLFRLVTRYEKGASPPRFSARYEIARASMPVLLWLYGLRMRQIARRAKAGAER